MKRLPVVVYAADATLPGSDLLALARKAVSRLRDLMPPGTTVEDAIQDACIHILVKWNKGERRSAHLVMAGWSGCKNEYAKTFRKHFSRHRYKAGDNIVILPVEGVMDQQQLADLEIDVATVVDALPKRQKVYAREYWIEGKIQADIARDHGVTQGAVNRVLHRAAVRLREALISYASED